MSQKLTTSILQKRMSSLLYVRDGPASNMLVSQITRNENVAGTSLHNEYFRVLGTPSTRLVFPLVHGPDGHLCRSLAWAFAIEATLVGLAGDAIVKKFKEWNILAGEEGCKFGHRDDLERFMQYVGGELTCSVQEGGYTASYNGAQGHADTYFWAVVNLCRELGVQASPDAIPSDLTVLDAFNLREDGWPIGSPLYLEDQEEPDYTMEPSDVWVDDGGNQNDIVYGVCPCCRSYGTLDMSYDLCPACVAQFEAHMY